MRDVKELNKMAAVESGVMSLLTNVLPMKTKRLIERMIIMGLKDL